MMWIEISLSLILGALSLLHALWALGSSWPLENDPMLVKAVVGAPGRTEMPAKWQSAFVSLCLAGAALWPHLIEQAITIPYVPAMLISLGGWALTFVFLIRGFVGLTPWFHNLLPDEPFASLNRRYYSPLCLILGIGFLFLLVG